MARCVLIIDSDTGKMIDVAGNVRETGRYRKLAARLLSADGKSLNYGIDGNDTLTISANGYKGKTINLLADEVNAPGTLKVGGKTVQQLVEQGLDGVTARILGTEGQIDVDEETDVSGKKVARISLDQNVAGKLQWIIEALEGMGASGFVTKSDVADVIRDVEVLDSDTLEDVKVKFRTVLERLQELVAGDES